MQLFDGIADGADAARSYIISNAATLPDHSGAASPEARSVKDRLLSLTGTGSSPVDLCAAFVDAVFANPDAFTAEAKATAAGIADQFDLNGYHQKLDGRAAGLRVALRRDSGEAPPAGRAWPAAEQDPAAKPEWAPPPPSPPAAPDQPVADGSAAPVAG